MKHIAIKFLFLLLAKYYETGGYQLEPLLGQSEIPTGKIILFFLDEPMNTGLSRDADFNTGIL